METKCCSKCKVEKPFTEFHKHPNAEYQSQCKKCQSEYLKKYYKTPKGKIYKKKYYEENKELFAEAGRKWKKLNPKKANQFVYNWAKNNTEQYVGIQDKYQSRISPSVYCIKYNDEVIYVGSSKKPQARVNIHLSTIKTATNLTKVNKLHSYCDYDKSRFKYEYLEQCDSDKLLERERYWEKELNAKDNYKKVFGKVKTITQIMKEEGTHNKY